MTSPIVIDWSSDDEATAAVAKAAVGDSERNSERNALVRSSLAVSPTSAQASQNVPPERVGVKSEPGSALETATLKRECSSEPDSKKRELAEDISTDEQAHKKRRIRDAW